MTTAQTGLATALARTASGGVIALAEMSADDLKASLSAEQLAGLNAAPAPALAADDMPPKKKDGCSDDEDGDDVGGDGDKPGKAAADAGNPAAAAAVPDRTKAVAAAVTSDENCKGKASVALAMLADDDFAGLSADALIKVIAKTPAPDAAAADPEAVDRAAMRAALGANSNSNADAGTKPSASKESSNNGGLWGRAIEANNPGFKVN